MFYYLEFRIYFLYMINWDCFFLKVNSWKNMSFFPGCWSVEALAAISASQLSCRWFQSVVPPWGLATMIFSYVFDNVFSIFFHMFPYFSYFFQTIKTKCHIEVPWFFLPETLHKQANDKQLSYFFGALHKVKLREGDIVWYENDMR